MSGFLEAGWIPIFFVAGVIIAGMAWKRRLDLKWIKKRFGPDLVIVSSFGACCFGLESDPGPLRPKKGVLLLMAGRLFFGNPRSGLELDIPGDRIMRVSHGVRHKNKELGHSVIIVDFLDAQGKVDRAAFKVPYPPQWIKAIGTAFALRKTVMNQPAAGRDDRPENTPDDHQ